LILSLNVLISTVLGILVSVAALEKRFDFILILLPLIILNSLLSQRRFRNFVFIFAVIALLISLAHFFPFKENKIPESLNGQVVSMYGSVSGFSEEAYYPKSFTLTNLSVDGKSYSGTLKVYTDDFLPPAYSRIKLEGKLTFYNNNTFVSDLSGSSYYLFSNSIEILKSNLLFRELSNLRSKIISNVLLSMKSEESFLLLSSIFGVQSLSQSEKEPYINTGTAHIFAVSGLHIGIIGEVLRFLLSKVTLFSPFFVIAILLVYLILIGFKVSAVRAFVMYSLTLLSKYIGIPAKSINSLFVSAILLLLISPAAIFSLSFYLSFAAVFALLVLPEFVENNFKASKLINNFVPLVSVQLFTLPLIASYFNVMPSSSFLANAILIPSLYLVAPVGFIELLFSSISLRLASFFAPFANIVFGALNLFINFLSSLPLSHVYINFSIFLMILSYALIFAVIFFLYKKRKALTVIATALLVFVFVFPLIYKTNIRSVKSFKGEDCVLLRENSTTILFFSLDSSSVSSSSYENLKSFLKQYGINTIDCVFVTHSVSNSDWSLAFDLLENEDFKAKNLFVPLGSVIPLEWSGAVYYFNSNSSISYKRVKLKFSGDYSFYVYTASSNYAFLRDSDSLSSVDIADFKEVYVPLAIAKNLTLSQEDVYKIVTY